MDLKKINEMGIELEQWLRMRVHPIAIKMLKNRGEVPEGAVIPSRDWGYKYSQCQAFAKSQRDGITVAMFKEDSWCPEPVIGYGFVEKNKYFLDGNHRLPSVRDLSAASEWCKEMPAFDYGKYEGIVSAPIGTCNFKPDLIVMHVNGMMISQLLIVKNWIDGKDLQCQLSGHAACVYAVVPALTENQCYVSIPCRGDRRLAGAQDDEILFTITPDILPDFIKGIRHVQENKQGLPIKEEYKEEHDLAPSYIRLGEEIGIDMRKSSLINKN